MAQQPKPTVELELPGEVIENKGKSQEDKTGFAQEMPTVTTLLQRKKLSTAVSQSPVETTQPIELSERRRSTKMIQVEPVAEATESPTTDPRPKPISSGVTLSQISVRKRGEPPPFRKTLSVESLTLKELKRRISKQKKFIELRKLHCLGYFASMFDEIAYFSLSSEPQVSGTSAQGRLAFGNPNLVSGIRLCGISEQLCPSIVDLMHAGAPFCGAAESLREEDTSSLAGMGFTKLAGLGIFPVHVKGALKGVWVCGTSRPEGLPEERELKELKKTLADLQLEAYE